MAALNLRFCEDLFRTMDHHHDNPRRGSHCLRRPAESAVPGRARGGAAPRIRLWMVMPSTLMAILGLTVIGVYQVQQFQGDLDRSAVHLARQAETEWKSNLRGLARLLNDNAGAIVADQAMIRAWRDGDLPVLDALAEPRFASLNQRYGITHLYFIASDGICELRAHCPLQRGDLINRFTFLESQRTGEDAWGIELGRFSTFTLRYVKPWRVDGRLLGYVELGMEIEHVAAALAKTLDARVTTFVKKEYTSAEKYEAGREAFGFAGQWDHYPNFVTTCQIARSFPADVLRQVESSLSPTAAAAVFTTREGGARLACVVTPLPDAAGRDVARLVVVRDVTVEANAAWRTLLTAHGLITLLSVVTLGLLWLASGKAERQLAATFAALRGSEQHMAATLRSIGDGVIGTDAAGRVTSLNAVAETLTGWRDADACGRPISNVFRVFNSASRKDATNPVWEALAEDRVIALADGTLLVARDGTERRIADSCSPIHDDAGNVVGAVLVFRDITKEYGQREALRASEEKYRALVENASDIIYSLNPDGRFTYLSPKWSHQLGHEVGETQGIDFRQYIHPDDVFRCSEFLRRVLETGQPHAGIEYRVRHKDGQWRWHRSNASALRDSEDRVVEYIGVARDVTAQKEAEEVVRRSKEEAERHVIALKSANQALEKLRGMAEAASRSKSEFLANMSHEIRTPITAILGYADILSDECDCPTARERAAVIKRNGEHLLGLINDILDLSKIEAGKMEPERIPCSPAELMAEVVALMRVRAEEKQLKLEVDTMASLPESVLTDPLRLRQILVNLVGNAIKFTDRGEVRLAAGLTRGTDPARLVFTVRDTGIGMTTEQIGALFRPFSQADTSAARKFGGTGLGLAISRRLAEALGGTIEVQSAPGNGSTFTVTIDPGPLDGVCMVRQESAGAVSAEQAAAPARETETNIKLPIRVLLAEDGPDNRRLITLFLERAGADVTAVEDGQAAVELAMASYYAMKPFDLILIDMQMPVMDGYAATGLLRELGYREPIVALTANAMADDRRKCLRAGCDDYLSKPINRQRLLDAVRAWTVARPRDNLSVG